MIVDGSLGPVELRVPPAPALSRVLRLAASGMASLAGFTIDEIEDIKIAVSEVLLALVERGAKEPVDLLFDIEDDKFVVSGRTVLVAPDLDDPDLALCRLVLEGACSAHGVELAGDELRIWAEVHRSDLA